MDRKIFINPHKKGNISSCVYVNRNFGAITNNSHSEEDNHSRFPILPHINPLFHRNTLYSNPCTSSNSTKSIIYVNPKILGVIDIKQNDVIEKNDLPVLAAQSKNKFSKVNPPKSKTETSTPNKDLKLHNIAISSKLCRSLVRKKQNPKYEENKNNVLLTKTKYHVTNIDRRPQLKTDKLNVLEKSHERKLINLPNLKKNDLNRSKRKINTKMNTSIHTPKKSLNLSKISSSPAKNIVFIGNEKYVLYGNVLRRLNSRIITPNSKRKIVKQICVNGKMFVRKSDNLFKECEKVSPKMLKKNNIHCPVYRKLGICVKNQKGKCIFVHDPKHIAICRKYLTGSCKLEGCFLSHDVSLEKMPTCKFFLEGCCSRDDCPYLHVKINEDSRICAQFMEGFCSSGKDCNNMHINVCPDFYKFSVCNRPKCPYPHKLVSIKAPRLSNSTKSIVDVPNVLSIDKCDTKVNDSTRYFIRNVTDSSNKSQIETCDNIIHATDNKSNDFRPSSSRPKLGKLPSFIAL